VLQEERSKAEQETLVNKAGTLTKLPSIRNPDDEPLPNEYIVVSPPSLGSPMSLESSVVKFRSAPTLGSLGVNCGSLMGKSSVCPQPVGNVLSDCPKRLEVLRPRLMRHALDRCAMARITSGF
jgi:hypothetical protein